MREKGHNDHIVSLTLCWVVKRGAYSLLGKVRAVAFSNSNKGVCACWGKQRMTSPACLVLSLLSLGKLNYGK